MIQQKDFAELEKIIGVSFKDKELLKTVFTHRSYLNEHRKSGLQSNEKLEFLGDSVLSLVTTQYLYHEYEELDEGIYTDIKSSIVRTERLAEAAESIQLGLFLLLSHGEETHGGRSNMNLLADSFEALIGALFIDQGYPTARTFIHDHLFKNRLKKIVDEKLYLSPKSKLQEIVQSSSRKLPDYQTLKVEGPEHKKMFTVSVLIDKVSYGEGTGFSKKEAEEIAAKKALEKIKSELYTIRNQS